MLLDAAVSPYIASSRIKFEDSRFDAFRATPEAVLRLHAPRYGDDEVVLRQLVDATVDLDGIEHGHVSWEASHESAAGRSRVAIEGVLDILEVIADHTTSDDHGVSHARSGKQSEA